jgi:hypothetical protein
MRDHYETVLRDVLRRDRPYVEWCVLEIENMTDELREALEYGLEHF